MRPSMAAASEHGNYAQEQQLRPSVTTTPKHGSSAQRYTARPTGAETLYAPVCANGYEPRLLRSSAA